MKLESFGVDYCLMVSCLYIDTIYHERNRQTDRQTDKQTDTLTWRAIIGDAFARVCACVWVVMGKPKSQY